MSNIIVSPADIAQAMLERRKKNQHDGYTNCLVDVLTDLYDLETKITREIKKQSGLDYQEFLEEPALLAVPGLMCANCGGDITNVNQVDAEGAHLCDDCWKEATA